MRRFISIVVFSLLTFLQVESAFALAPSAANTMLTADDTDHERMECCDENEFELAAKKCASDCQVAILVSCLDENAVARIRLDWDHTPNAKPVLFTPTGPPPILF